MSHDPEGSTLFVTNESDDRIVVRGRWVFDPGIETELIARGVHAHEIHACPALRVATTPTGDPMPGVKH